MKKILILLAVAGLSASCATLKLVETVSPAELPAAASAQTVTLAVEKITFASALLDIYQQIPGQAFYYGKVLDGVSNLIEFHHYNPQAAAETFTKAQLSELVLTTVEGVLKGATPFSGQLVATDFRNFTVANADQAGTAAPAASYEIRRGALPDKTEAGAFARSAGTDLTILVSAEVSGATGRASDALNTKAIMPMVVSAGQHIVLAWVSVSVDVYNRDGKRIYANASPDEKFRFYARTQDKVTILPDARSASDLDAFVRSPAFRELLVTATVKSSVEFVRQLRPHVLGRYVEVKEEKK